MHWLFLAGTPLLALAASVASAEAEPVTFGYTGGLQTYTAPSGGDYDVLAVGAGGGNASYTGSGHSGRGGLGATAESSDVFLLPGDVLQIAVGGRGGDGAPAIGLGLFGGAAEAGVAASWCSRPIAAFPRRC